MVASRETMVIIFPDRNRILKKRLYQNFAIIYYNMTTEEICAIYITIHGYASRKITIAQSATGLSRWVYGLRQKKIKYLPFQNYPHRPLVSMAHARFDLKE